MYRLTHERLLEVLDYDPETGLFTWKLTAAKAKAGAVAGCVHVHGYRCIGIDGERFRAHRLAWLFVHGVWPANEIDHINGARDDNRLCNLREATSLQNQANRRISSRSKSGVKGVFQRSRDNRWYARLMVNGRRHELGSYLTKEEAAAAYAKAAAELQGEFAPAETLGRAA